jgi:predicted ester cyclase
MPTSGSVYHRTSDGKWDAPGELMGIPPTGKRMTITGIDIVRIAGGKLVELWQK